MGKQKVFKLNEYRKKERTVAGLEPLDNGDRGTRFHAPLNKVKAFLKERKWLLLALLLMVLICLLPTPRGLTVQGKYALGLWAFVVMCFLTEAVPLPMTAMLIGCYQVFTGIASFREVPRTFMDDAVIFIMGVLMMGAMLMKYNIHNRVALFMLKLCGARIERVILGIVAFCAISAGFITEHAAVMIMLPIGVGIVSLSGGYKKVPNLAKLIMLSIAYGVMIGSVSAPSGGARNALMLGLLSSLGINIGYGQWMLLVMPFTLIMIPIVSYWLLNLFSPEITDLSGTVQAIREEMEADGPMTSQARMALAIFLAVVVSWIFASQRFGVGNIAMVGILLAAVLRLIDWSYLQQKTQWGVVLLYAGAISMGKMLIATGAASWLAGQFLHLAAVAEVTEGISLLAVTATVTALVTNTMADGPTVAVLGPIFLKVAELSRTSPLVIGVATSLASAFSYLLVIATPANAIVYGPGFLRAQDFLKAGGVLFLISLVLTVAFLGSFWWRVLGVW
jgi:sodium-dependent dicarboxylate transporter 2/3/5